MSICFLLAVLHYFARSLSMKLLYVHSRRVSLWQPNCLSSSCSLASLLLLAYWAGVCAFRRVVPPAVARSVGAAGDLRWQPDDDGRRA